MKLICTPRSHFARKVRILLLEMGLPHELEFLDNIGKTFQGPNPLMKVPTLVDGGRVVFESDYISSYLVRKAKRDVFQVNLDPDATELWNLRAVMNSVMATEAELVLAARAGLDLGASPRFAKMRSTIVGGLNYVEQHSHLFGGGMYGDFHLVSMLDHVRVFGVLGNEFPSLPKLSKIVDSMYKKHESVRATEIPPLPAATTQANKQ